MRTEPRRLLASLGATALLLLAGGPASFASGAGAGSAPSPGAGSGPSSTPPGLVPAACIETPPPGAHCDTLWVPLDYADPSLGTIPTSVVVVPATDPAERIGSLLVNPGGPGESGVQFVDQAYALFATLNQRFDIVGFDPRGTTGPDAVTCEGTDGLDHAVGLDPLVAGSATAEADMVASTLAFDSSCRLHSGWLLPYVGTVNAARDMDALRAALGDPQLTYLGFSYGTALGATYASLFPTHVRAMVLDGDIDPALSFMEESIQQGASFEASYDEFVSQCQAETDCPLGSDPGATITALLARLAASPVETAGGRTVGRGMVVGGLVAAMYDPGAASMPPSPRPPGVRSRHSSRWWTATPAGAPWATTTAPRPTSQSTVPITAFPTTSPITMPWLARCRQTNRTSARTRSTRCSPAPTGRTTGRRRQRLT